MKYDIWSEGYLATGMEGIPAKAQLVVEGAEGKDFGDAVQRWVASKDKEWLINHWGDYSHHDGHHFLWGCELFPTEEEARKAFG